MNFDENKLVTYRYKTDPLIVEATKKLEVILKKLKELALNVIKHLKRLDPLKYMDNMSKAEELVARD